MDAATLRDELDKAIRDINLEIEEYELEHQEQKRLIGKWMREAENWLRGEKSSSRPTVDQIKRTLSRVLAEDSKHVPARSSRSAAKAAATKIKCAIDLENEGNSKKRRCVIKIERISAPQSVLDIIEEEQEINSMSPEAEETQAKPEVSSATVDDKPQLDLQKTINKDNNVDSPSSENLSPFQKGAVANSTFVFDAVKPGTLKCVLPDVSDKANRDCETSPANSVQDKDGSGLHSTFVISKVNEDIAPDKMEEDKPLEEVLTKTSENHTVNMKGNKTKQSQAKMPVGKGQKETEEIYSDLQKLIIESPVRVTRTKTRAFAQAQAQAAAAVSNSKENVQVSGNTHCIMSPPFQKNYNKIRDDNMKENYIVSDKAMKEIATKELNSAHRLKTPLSANNTLSSNSFQSSKMGMGTLVSHCESFITKNVTKPALNQKLIEDNKFIDEKVTEAEKKKEKMLKEKAELQRRNNEARAAKVAKTREQLERQRLIQQQQLERDKEQRLRIAQQKREEELALKRQLAHQRALEAEERRKQEEEQYIQAIKKKEQEEAQKKALQLKKEAEEQSKAKEAEKNKKDIKVKPNGSEKVAKAKPNGVFNTNDIYSGEESEDEEVTVQKKLYPSWTSASRVRSLQLFCQDQCGSLIAQFFQFKPHTPDLVKIFGTVPEKALVRTSSAVWHTPPCNKTFN